MIQNKRDWLEFLDRMPYFNLILEVMCCYNKTKVINIKVWKKDWQNKHTWTQLQQDDFREWMIEYLYKDKYVRRGIMSNPLKNKKLIKKTVDWFILNYGWRVKNQKVYI